MSLRAVSFGNQPKPTPCPLSEAAVLRRLARLHGRQFSATPDGSKKPKAGGKTRDAPLFKASYLV